MTTPLSPLKGRNFIIISKHFTFREQALQLGSVGGQAQQLGRLGGQVRQLDRLGGQAPWLGIKF